MPVEASWITGEASRYAFASQHTPSGPRPERNRHHTTSKASHITGEASRIRR